MKQKKHILLYGANGYTGELIIRYAKDKNVPLTISGRTNQSIQPLAEKYNLEYRIFSLDDVHVIAENLSDILVVIHAAGPFSRTAAPMVEACIKTNTHYLDINGDLSVFEMIRRYDEQAQQADVMLLPGAGFDVVPTDCIAMQLKKQMPDATSLKLGFITKGSGGLSHGTATTMIEKLGEGGAERKNGKIVRVPLGHASKNINIQGRDYFCMTIPWGDVATAFYSTGIPDIETYIRISKWTYLVLRMQGLFNWILRRKVTKKFIQDKIDARPPGPSDEQRENSFIFVWGEAYNEKGETSSAQLTCKEGYTFTALSCLWIAEQVTEENYKPGFQTPSMAYGEKMVYNIEGSTPL
jgi:short subunit dehydrogenase-like uncharacterized protein